MKKCQPFGLMVAFMVLVTLCLAQEGRDEKEASSTTIDTRRSHEVVRPEDVKWGRPRRSYCRARNSRCCSGIHPNPEPRMFSGPDSRTAIAWRRIGIPWTRMSPSSAESSEWDLAKSSTSMCCEICPLDLTRCCHVVYFTITASRVKPFFSSTA